MIQTIEHVSSPPEVLAAVHALLKPGGRLLIVTDNTDSLDFSVFKSRHWGGYHSRHFNLFNRKSLGRLAHKCGYNVDVIRAASAAPSTGPIHCVTCSRTMAHPVG